MQVLSNASSRRDGWSKEGERYELKANRKGKGMLGGYRRVGVRAPARLPYSASPRDNSPHCTNKAEVARPRGQGGRTMGTERKYEALQHSSSKEYQIKKTIKRK